MSPARSPLHEVHTRLGARFVDFGGWEMPLQYRSVIEEHLAVRLRAGWFDVSHLGRFSWHGPGATDALLRLLSNDVRRIEPGRTQYSMMLDDEGGVVDDLIVWRWDDEDYWILPNAANHARVMEAFRAEAPAVGIEDLRPSTVALAVQGPDAPAAIAEVLGEAPRRFRTFRARFRGAPVSGAGTGYTGERGGEVVLAADPASALIEALTERGVVPCGLGARDTLRLEAGLPLWGNDLDETITPLEAGLDFAVPFTHDFRGRAALERMREHGPRRRLVGFRTGSRQVPRHGHRLRAGEAEGWVSSGNFSPVLGEGIGIGYLPAGAEGPLEVEIRGRWVPVQRCPLPFVGH